MLIILPAFSGSGLMPYTNKFIFIILSIALIFILINQFAVVAKIHIYLWGFLLFISALQILSIGTSINLKGLLNFLGFFIISVTIYNIFSWKYRLAMVSLQTLKYVIISILLFFNLYLISEFGFFELFSISQNYLYASISNSFSNLVDKQFLSAIFLLGGIFIVQEIYAKANILNLFRLPLLIFAVYMTLGSRSMVLGFLISILTIFLHRKFGPRFASFAIVCLLGFGFFALSTGLLDFLEIFDIRYGIYSGLIEVSIMNPFLGVGLFNIPNYLEANNLLLYQKTSHLFDSLLLYNLDFITFTIDRFPINGESSYFILAAEIGLMSALFIYYIITLSILNVFANANGNLKNYSFFILCYLFSSVTEDNLFQTSFIVSFSYLIAIAASLNTSARSYMGYFGAKKYPSESF